MDPITLMAVVHAMGILEANDTVSKTAASSPPTAPSSRCVVYQFGDCPAQDEEGGMWDTPSSKGWIEVYVSIGLALLVMVITVLIRYARRRWDHLDTANWWIRTGANRLRRRNEARRRINAFDIETGTALDPVMHIPAPRVRCPDRYPSYELARVLHPVVDTPTRPPPCERALGSRTMSAPPPSYESAVRQQRYSGARH